MITDHPARTPGVKQISTDRSVSTNQKHATICKKSSRARTIILLLVSASFVLSCTHRFAPVQPRSITTEEKGEAVKENIQENKYFILRHPSGSYAMKNIKLDQYRQVLQFQLADVSPEHSSYIVNPRKRTYRDQNTGILDEVHLYTTADMTLAKDSVIALPVKGIQKIEVIINDKAPSATTAIIGGGAVMAVIAALLLLTKSSCPFVSAYDGEDYDLQGELFGGALYPSSERADYVPLKIKPINGEYNIRISNELQERQYTNFAKLLVVSHDNNVRALTDLQGNIHTVRSPIPPLKAVINQVQDVTHSVATKDDHLCAFDDTSSKDNINSLELTYTKPAEAQKAKLLLQLKNSYWFDYLYGEFNKAFGSYYNRWVKKQNKVPAPEHDKWSTEQHIPLQVSVKTDSGWKEVCSIKSIGPLMNREVLIPIDLHEVNSKDLQLKLTTGFMFWELDQAVVDYSADLSCAVQALDPFEALDESGVSVLNSLKYDDHSYLDQLHPGKAAVLKYRGMKEAGAKEATSVILYTKGYYQPIRDYKGKPQLAFLKGFRTPGAFAAFSRQRFELLKKENLFAANDRQWLKH